MDKQREYLPPTAITPVLLSFNLNNNKPKKVKILK